MGVARRGRMEESRGDGEERQEEEHGWSGVGTMRGLLKGHYGHSPPISEERTTDLRSTRHLRITRTTHLRIRRRILH